MNALREEALRRWDTIRAEILAGADGDAQRMVFEDILDRYEIALDVIRGRVRGFLEALEGDPFIMCPEAISWLKLLHEAACPDQTKGERDDAP
ncbi:MAG: hypothetical protein AB7O04_16810 [Hyphomonadaceae bacterium]